VDIAVVPKKRSKITAITNLFTTRIDSEPNTASLNQDAALMLSTKSRQQVGKRIDLERPESQRANLKSPI